MCLSSHAQIKPKTLSKLDFNPPTPRRVGIKADQPTFRRDIVSPVDDRHPAIQPIEPLVVFLSGAIPMRFFSHGGAEGGGGGEGRQPSSQPCMDPCTDPCMHPSMDPCIDPCLDPCMDECMVPCMDSCMDPCMDPCIHPCMDPCMDACMLQT